MFWRGFGGAVPRKVLKCGCAVPRVASSAIALPLFKCVQIVGAFLRLTYTPAVSVCGQVPSWCALPPAITSRAPSGPYLDRADRYLAFSLEYQMFAPIIQEPAAKITIVAGKCWLVGAGPSRCDHEAKRSLWFSAMYNSCSSFRSYRSAGTGRIDSRRLAFDCAPRPSPI